MSANISINEGTLCIDIKGIYKVLSFKSQLKIPLKQIRSIEQYRDCGDKWFKGIRAPGINIPNIITAGTFYQEGEKIFLDVIHPDKSIVITLKDNSYSKVIIEVNDPHEMIKKINKELRTSRVW